MFAQRVRPDELIDLLAAESYDPVLMQYCARTQKSPKLDAFLADKARLGVTGTIANAYVPEGTDAAVPYLTTTQVGGFYAHLDGCKYITAEADRNWAKCRVPDGAIVLNKSGNVGAAAIVACAPYTYVNTVSDLINIRPRRPRVDDKGRAIDSEYLVVFLNSPFGQSQLQRLSGGAIFDHVSLHAVPKIRVFEPHPLAQRYIGDKVRQAEQLRERARRLGEDLIRPFNALVSDRVRTLGNSRSWRVPSRGLSGRLDPGANHVRLVALREELAARGRTTFVGDLIDTPIPSGVSISEFVSSGPYYVRIADFDRGYWDASAACVSSANHGSNAKGHLRQSDVVFARIGNTLGKVGFADACVPTSSLSNNCSLLRPTVGDDGPWLYWCLRSELGAVQVKCLKSQTAQPKISPADIESIVLPHPVERSPKFNALTEAHFLASRLADGLIIAAKQLVERMIEGTISETDLVAAQQAIEAGDRAADRAVLQKLRQGNDENAEPIFADLDGLYDLLDADDDRGGD